MQELKPTDTGTLHVTSERIAFDGGSNISIWFDRLDVLPQWSQEGFLVLQRGDRDILLKVGDGQDAMAWAVLAAFLVTSRRGHQDTGRASQRMEARGTVAGPRLSVGSAGSYEGRLGLWWFPCYRGPRDDTSTRRRLMVVIHRDGVRSQWRRP